MVEMVTWGLGGTGKGRDGGFAGWGGTGVGRERDLRDSFSSEAEDLLTSNGLTLLEDSGLLLELLLTGSEDFLSCSSFWTAELSTELSL